MDAVRQMILWKKRAAASAVATPLLDTYSGAAAAYSTRIVRTAHAGNCCRIRRSSDNTQQNFGFVNGWLDTASVATFIGGGSGFLHTWYDQSGNNKNFSNTGSSSQMLYVASDPATGRPAFQNVSSDYLGDGFGLNVVTGAGGLTVLTVCGKGTSVADQCIFSIGIETGTGRGFEMLAVSGVTPAVQVYGVGTASGAAGSFPINTTKAFAGRYAASGAKSIALNGVASTPVAGTAPDILGWAMYIGTEITGVSKYWSGPTQEVVIYAGSSVDWLGAQGNQMTAFNLT